MIYLRAVRALLVLMGILIAFYVVILLAGAVSSAFLYSWITACLALSFVCGLGALYGYQLLRTAKTERARLIGLVSFSGFGVIALLALSVPVDVYVWITVVPWLLARVGLII